MMIKNVENIIYQWKEIKIKQNKKSNINNNNSFNSTIYYKPYNELFLLFNGNILQSGKTLLKTFI